MRDQVDRHIVQAVESRYKGAGVMNRQRIGARRRVVQASPEQFGSGQVMTDLGRPTPSAINGNTLNPGLTTLLTGLRTDSTSTCMIFIVGDDGALHVNQQTPPGTWTNNWTSLGTPTGTSFSAQAATTIVWYYPAASLVYGVVVTDATGGIWMVGLDVVSAAWQPWIKIGQLPSGTAAGALATGSTRDNRLVVFTASSDGIGYIIEDPSSRGFTSGWQLLPGLPLPSQQSQLVGLDVAQDVAGQLEVFVSVYDPNTPSEILVNVENGANSDTWNGWESLGSPAAGSAFANEALLGPRVIGDQQTGCIDLFVTSNGELFHLRQAPDGTWAGSNWMDLSAPQWSPENPPGFWPATGYTSDPNGEFPMVVFAAVNGATWVLPEDDPPTGVFGAWSFVASPNLTPPSINWQAVWGWRTWGLPGNALFAFANGDVWTVQWP